MRSRPGPPARRPAARGARRAPAPPRGARRRSTPPRRRRRPRRPASASRPTASARRFAATQSAARPVEGADVDHRAGPTRGPRPAPARVPQAQPPRSMSPVVTNGRPVGPIALLVRRGRPCRSTRFGTRPSWWPRPERAGGGQVDDGHAVGAAEVRAPSRARTAAAPPTSMTGTQTSTAASKPAPVGDEDVDQAAALRRSASRTPAASRAASTDCGCTMATRAARAGELARRAAGTAPRVSV